MKSTAENTGRTAGRPECRHQYTFKKEYLFQNMNAIFSRKICEKCGKEIVLDRRSRNRIVMFTALLVILLVIVETLLKQILPDISYTAKALVVVLLFCVAFGTGLYQLMNRATYVTYTPSERSRQFRDAYEQARRENDERTRLRYEESVRKREEKRLEKQNRKK